MRAFKCFSVCVCALFMAVEHGSVGASRVLLVSLDGLSFITHPCVISSPWVCALFGISFAIASSFILSDRIQEHKRLLQFCICWDLLFVPVLCRCILCLLYIYASIWHQFFILKHLFLIMCVCYLSLFLFISLCVRARVCVHIHTLVQVPMEFRREHWNSWSYRWWGAIQAGNWTLRSSARALKALNTETSLLPCPWSLDLPASALTVLRLQMWAGTLICSLAEDKSSRGAVLCLQLLCSVRDGGNPSVRDEMEAACVSRRNPALTVAPSSALARRWRSVPTALLVSLQTCQVPVGPLEGHQGQG